MLALVPVILCLSPTVSAQSSARPGLPPVTFEPLPALDPCPCPAWLLSGNVGTNATNHFLGTLDNKPLSIRVFNLRAMQYVFATNGSYRSINVLGGMNVNSIGPGVIGATIAGGGWDDLTSFDYPNQVHADFGAIGGGAGNLVQSMFGTVGGGESNTASGSNATISGGSVNFASGQGSTIGGGLANTVSQFAATVSGGEANAANALYATVGGGQSNYATGDFATVGGGASNGSKDDAATIAGGLANLVGAPYGSIGGGQANLVNGIHGTIPGGQSNVVSGDFGLAAGQQAQALHQGAFVWADSTNAVFASTATDQLSVRAAGGTRVFSDAAATIGVLLAPNAGTWTTASDRDAKRDVEPVDAREVLERLSDVPISTWSYRDQEGVRHMGPMAQDFYAAFALGLGEKTIDTVDPDGVALAAIQGLHSLVDEQRALLERQRAEIGELRSRLEVLERRRD